MSSRSFTHITLEFSLLFFIVSRPLYGSDFQTVYDSAKKIRSVEIGERALELAEIHGNEEQLAKSHFLIAYYQDEKGMYYQALNHYFSALYNYQEARNYGRQIGTLMNIGAIYYVGGFYEKAIDFYKDARDMAKDMNDISRFRSIQYNIGQANRAMGNYEEANNIYLRLLAQKNDIKNKSLLNDCYTELGLIAGTHLKEYELAEDYFTHAVNIYSPADKDYVLAKVKSMNGIAYLQMMRGQLDDAKQLFNEALSLSTTNEFDKTALVDVYGNLGSLYEKIDEPDSSILMYEKGLELEPLNKFDKKYIQTANLLYKYHRAKSPERMDHYHDLIYQYGLEFAKLKAQLIQASHEYQIRAADYRRELDLRIAREKRMLWWDIFSYALTLIVIASGISFYFMEKRKRRKRLRKALDNARIIVPLPEKY